MKRFGKGKVFFSTLVLLGAVLLGQSAVATANAYDGEEICSDSISEEMTLSLLGEEFPDNEELFAQYVEIMFYGALDEPVVNDAGRNRLTEPGKALYDAFKPEIIQIARGEETSTVITIDPDTCAEWEERGVVPLWSAEELGVDVIDDSTKDAAVAAFRANIKELIGKYVWRALMHDCPYEMYWQDKVTGITYNYSYSYTESAMWLYKFTLYFHVADAYQGDGDYVTDATKTAATGRAVQNALAIVAEHQTETDYGKLKSYCDEIQNLSDYNYDAVEDDYTGGYGDPWQLIYVFDEDPETKVVCEGFSKAFQYLCDASDFYNDKVACYTVSGLMDGGGHMWNTVTMGNGNNYLVDVTNHKSYRNLFLVGTSGSIQNGYRFEFGNGAYAIKFVYYDETKKLWGTSADSILTLANSNYATCNTGHTYPEDWTLTVKPTKDGHGVLTKSCTSCGELQEKEVPFLNFASASLSLHSNLTVNYKVDASFFEAMGYENPYVVFLFHGEEIAVRDYTVDGDRYVFSFRNVAANQMTDAITATIYAQYEGQLIEGKTVEAYSVAKYCYNMLNKYKNATSEKEITERTMLVDLLNYGAAAQIYTDYRTSALANASVTPEMVAWASAGLPELDSVTNSNYATVANPTAKWEGIGLRMDDAVTIRYRFTTSEPSSNLTVKVTDGNGKSWTIPSSQFVSTESGYYVYFSGLNAAEMSVPVYATVYKGNSAVSNTVRYSIESFVSAKQSGTSAEDVKDRELVIPMMKYGFSALKYAQTYIQ